MFEIVAQGRFSLKLLFALTTVLCVGLAFISRVLPVTDGKRKNVTVLRIMNRDGRERLSVSVKYYLRFRSSGHYSESDEIEFVDFKPYGSLDFLLRGNTYHFANSEPGDYWRTKFSSDWEAGEITPRMEKEYLDLCKLLHSSGIDVWDLKCRSCNSYPRRGEEVGDRCIYKASFEAKNYWKWNRRGFDWCDWLFGD